MVRFFSKNPNTPRFKLDIGKTLIVFVLIIVLVQALGILFGFAGIKLGPIFMLLLISSVTLASFALAKKQLQGHEVSKKDIFAIVALIIVAVLGLIYLRELVPEVFQQSMINLKIATQSIIPLP